MEACRPEISWTSTPNQVQAIGVPIDRVLLMRKLAFAALSHRFLEDASTDIQEK